MKKSYLVLVCIIFQFCDLQNRYPDKGEFCVPMVREEECLKVDFRMKTLEYQKKEFVLKMNTRVDYIFNEIDTLQILGEHRVQIIQGSEKKIFIRKKGEKISIWRRIKTLMQK